MTPHAATPSGATGRGGRRTGRASRRAGIEAEDFARSRSVAALHRGDSLALEDVARRPNAALAAGVVVALLVAAGAAVTAFAGGRAPAGWRAEDTLVLDKATGARYVVLHGVLRPAPTLTAAVLAGSGHTPVLVPHAALRAVRVGPALPGAHLPESPPVVPARPAPLLACTTSADGASDGAVQVWSGPVRTAPAVAGGLLVRTPDSSALLLVTGDTAYPLAAAAVERLGYSVAQVRTVPGLWLHLLRPGVRLAPLPVPPRDPAAAVPGVGLPGDVVSVAGSGQRLLVAGGRLHPFLNRTSELLAPPPGRQVSGALAAALTGAAVGVLQAPSSPPTVPVREDVVSACVRSTDGTVSVTTAVRAPGTQAAPERQVTDAPGAPVRVVWHQRPGAGALLGPPGVRDEGSAGAVPDPSGARGARVVTGGVAYPLADQRAMAALGLDRHQALALPPAWLALAAAGPTLRASS